MKGGYEEDSGDSLDIIEKESIKRRVVSVVLPPFSN